jgi:hypothetical protein
MRAPALSAHDRSVLAIASGQPDQRTRAVDVRLIWSVETDDVFAAVDDQRRGDSFEFEVDAADALEAFHHPFAYASTAYNARSLPLEHLAGSYPGPEEEQ